MSVKLAELEQELGVRSTYFVMLTNENYNVFSKESHNCCQKIIKCGHEIGLHFDEVIYPEFDNDLNAIKNKIVEECNLLAGAVEMPVTVVSMHRPSKMILDSDLQIPNVVNSYGSVYFKEFKYLSDSRRRWRESVGEIIDSGDYKRLHILTHAFWSNAQEKTLQESLLDFINKGDSSRYQFMNSNFSDLEKEVKMEQIHKCYVRKY